MSQTVWHAPCQMQGAWPYWICLRENLRVFLNIVIYVKLYFKRRNSDNRKVTVKLSYLAVVAVFFSSWVRCFICMCLVKEDVDELFVLNISLQYLHFAFILSSFIKCSQTKLGISVSDYKFQYNNTVRYINSQFINWSISL